ncbi:MAG: glycerol-3-phosphate acyltransferase [Adlercreutzia equolifaciens]
MDTVITYLTLSFIVSFLLGSIPWGVIVSKLAFHKDIRDEGSGNIGTTNAFRAMGKVRGALVFVLDFGKGFCPAGSRPLCSPGHSRGAGGRRHSRRPAASRHLRQSGFESGGPRFGRRFRGLHARPHLQPLAQVQRR